MSAKPEPFDCRSSTRISGAGPMRAKPKVRGAISDRRRRFFRYAMMPTNPFEAKAGSLGACRNGLSSRACPLAHRSLLTFFARVGTLIGLGRLSWDSSQERSTHAHPHSGCGNTYVACRFFVRPNHVPDVDDAVRVNSIGDEPKSAHPGRQQLHRGPGEVPNRIERVFERVGLAKGYRRRVARQGHEEWSFRQCGPGFSGQHRQRLDCRKPSRYFIKSEHHR
jgi:hypothetical protein